MSALILNSQVKKKKKTCLISKKKVVSENINILKSLKNLEPIKSEKMFLDEVVIHEKQNKKHYKLKRETIQ